MPSRPEPLRLVAGDALLVVDVQNDFLPGGRLGVAGGHEVVPVLNHYLALWRARGLPVFAARCWHPEDHRSFQEQGGPWPPHCVAGTPGGELAAALALPPSARIVSKGTTAEAEAYSAFGGTSLHDDLRAAGVARLFIGGFATDYCVLETVRDARARGLEVIVLEDAVRAVDQRPGDGRQALAEMERLGARFARVETIAAG